MTEIEPGATSQSFFMSLRMANSGTPFTGITTGVNLQYTRIGANAAAPVALTAGSLTAWGANTLTEVDATNSPGIYKLDVPDAALAGGTTEVAFTLTSTTLALEPVTRVIRLAPVVITAEVTYRKSDVGNAQDVWTVEWLRNGALITSGVTAPDITVFNAADGSPIITQKPMTQPQPNEGLANYIATGGERVGAGVNAAAWVDATIDGVKVTRSYVVGRDA